MTKKRKIIIAIISAFILAGIILTSVFLPLYFSKDKTFDKYTVLGYLPLWCFEDTADLEKIDFSKLTHINISFATVEKESLVPKINEKDIPNLEMLMAFLTEKNIKSKVLLSIGGAGASNFCEASATEATRKNFAKECKDIVEKFKIDGIDMDWEFPGVPWLGISSCKNCKKDYVLLMQEIRTAIGAEKLLTYAATANLTMIDDFDNKKLAAIVDFVNVMTYDFSDTNQSDFELSKNAMFMWSLQGYKKTQINIGVPFYGRSKDEKLQYAGYDKIKEMETSGKCKIVQKHSESYAMVGKSKISFDTPAQIKKKGQWSKKTGYGGIFCWQLFSDYNNELLNAMYDGING